jgi:CRISPR-associated endonuclease/helicase Cas3
LEELIVMMVTFISQCEKKAYKKTRRVLDAFANRIGDNTWQTVITQEGLNAVRKLLRKTATKNTAVGCHWIHSRARSEFLWAVGNRNKFNEQGIVPVNYTEKNMLNSEYENDWKYLPLIKALSSMSALFHDWGKTSDLFQNKLKPTSKYKYKGDPIRHEWVTCLLLNAFVQNISTDSDKDWLISLTKSEFNEEQIIETATQQESKPLHNLPNAAKLITWLIVSHHRMPTPSTKSSELRKDWLGEPSETIDVALKRITQKWGYENRQDEKEFLKRVKGCFKFSNGLLNQSATWRKQIKKSAHRLLDCLPLVDESFSNGSFRLVLHYARLCLMLGDHYYSSQDADSKWKDTTGTFANSDKSGYKQKLDEHLCGVAHNAFNIARYLPEFEKEPPTTGDVRALRVLSPTDFRWQDSAVKKITLWKKDHCKSNSGFFAVNMASTGCGKTFANAKVMRALSDDGKSLRYILALGLRTLTLQTGDEYRERIGLDNTELGVLIGSKAVLELHQQVKADEEKSVNENYGVESSESLLDQDIDYDSDLPEEKLSTVLKQDKDRKFLYAPVLACTIDHVMGATETKRGGRYILPTLRLMSSDLVIDEIDDFTGSDLIAIGRLIHLAGMLGRKVMISSATIPPDLAEGYFNAYRCGWQTYTQSRDSASDEIGCTWIDEFKTSVCTINNSHSESALSEYRKSHGKFIEKRVDKLSQQPAKRKAEIIECQTLMDDCEFDAKETKQSTYFLKIKETIVGKHHQHNTQDEKSNIMVSFGVIRVANISPCIALAKFLVQADFDDEIEVRVMAYHSQQVLLLRHEQEKHLDAILKRKEKAGEQPKAFKDPIVRNHLDNCKAQHLTFVLVATPVEEVGRDHDFDWAVVEPSSYRSIIQLAGRVKRHRDGETENPNIALMQYNWKAFKDGDQNGGKYFRYPGYEDIVNLNTHNLSELIETDVIANRLDAIPRIKKPEQLDYKNSLADLEHAVIQSDLVNYQQLGPETLQGYLSETWYLTALPQYLNQFRKSAPATNVFLIYKSESESLCFAERDDQGYMVDRGEILQITQTTISKEECENLWLIRDYKKSLEQESEMWESSKESISRRFGELSFIQYEGSEYEYNDQFGLVKSLF